MPIKVCKGNHYKLFREGRCTYIDRCHNMEDSHLGHERAACREENKNGEDAGDDEKIPS